jgi:hypothetical protein
MSIQLMQLWVKLWIVPWIKAVHQHQVQVLMQVLIQLVRILLIQEWVTIKAPMMTEVWPVNFSLLKKW